MPDRQVSRSLDDAAPQGLSHGRTPFGAVCVLVGLGLLVPAVYYAYLDVSPPVQRQGDISFGDGTGLVLGAVAGIPAVGLLVAGILVPTLSRRRHHR